MVQGVQSGLMVKGRINHPFGFDRSPAKGWANRLVAEGFDSLKPTKQTI